MRDGVSEAVPEVRVGLREVNYVIWSEASNERERNDRLAFHESCLIC